MPTVEAVCNKLDQPMPMGYCNVGEVVEVGPGVTGFEVRDRVASNSRHAKIVSMQINLCANMPAGVSDDQAAFTVLVLIGLQGIRLVLGAVEKQKRPTSQWAVGAEGRNERSSTRSAAP
jgi:hypothetical protein